MSRLQKKCFIASTGLHSLLLLILFVGPAFQSHKSMADDAPLLDILPSITTDENKSGGDNRPVARQPVVQPPAPQPPAAPPPRPQKEIEPPKEVVKEAKADPESLEIAKTKKPVIDTKRIVKNPNLRDKPKPQTETVDNSAKEQDDAKRRLAQQIRSTVGTLARDTEGSTTIKFQDGGGRGPAYANFLQAVKTVYTRAWILPEAANEDEATAVATVTIARDGTVLSARIIQFSRNHPVDRSVQATLERVKIVVPLPADAKEDQRTVTINFNAQAKRALG